MKLAIAAAAVVCFVPAVGYAQFVCPKPGDPEIRAWIADHVDKELEQKKRTAAGVVLVCGGERIVEQVAGYFDPVRKEPIAPEHQFKLASVTKTFNGIAISILVARGQIGSIHDPANRYLRRYQIPGEWGDDVTIAQLLSHSSGMESPEHGLAADNQDSIPASADYLDRYVPQIVREPGKHVVYANFGMGLVGTLVEDVTGQRYDEFLRDNVLRPLGMNNSALEYARDLGPLLIRPGIVNSEEADSPVTYAQQTKNAAWAAPSGSMQASIPDMGNYLLAMLGHAPEVITPAISGMQRQKIISNYPGLPAAGLGIFTGYWNDLQYWTHSGLIAGFSSDLIIFPDLDLGIFVAYAGGRDEYGSGAESPDRAIDAVLTELLGPNIPRPAIEPTVHAKDVIGRYWIELRSHTYPETVYHLTRVVEVAEGEEGEILVHGRPVVEVAPGLFRSKEQQGGRSQYLALDGDYYLGDIVYGKRVSGLGDPKLWQMLLMVLPGILITGVLSVFRRGWPRLAALGSVLIGGTIVAVLILPPLMGGLGQILSETFTGVEWRYRVVGALGWLCLPLGLVSLVAAIRSWRRAGNSVLVHLGNIHLATLGLAAFGLAILLGTLNFL